MPRALHLLVGLALLPGCVESLAVLGPADGGARDTSTTDSITPIDAAPDAGPSTSIPRPVAAGVTHTCAILGGNLYCWGDNRRGQLGLGDNTDRNNPQRVGTRSDWVQIAAGEFHTCGITSDGTLHCWGGNAEGEVGIGDGADRLEPAAIALPGPTEYVDVGYHHACVIVVGGAISCWGDNVEGQLGLDDWDDRFSPTPLASGVRWTRVALGQASSIALSDRGELWGWGRNSDDHLGLGPGALVQRQSPTFIRDGSFELVAAAQNTSGALENGDLYAWGGNSSAQFGDGTRIGTSTPTLAVAGQDYIDYELGTFSGCAIARVSAAVGTLNCWGRNAEGQLGIETNDDQLSPTQAGVLDDWAQVSVGRMHMCARRADDSVYCTGENSAGQLGAGDNERRNGMTPVTIIPM
jgi:alpha-tubulin suppressor-like RCC1 family protein